MTRTTKPVSAEDVDARTLADRVDQTIAVFETHLGLTRKELGVESIAYYVRQGKTPRQIVDETLRIPRPLPFA